MAADIFRGGVSGESKVWKMQRNLVIWSTRYIVNKHDIQYETLCENSHLLKTLFTVPSEKAHFIKIPTRYTVNFLVVLIIGVRCIPKFSARSKLQPLQPRFLPTSSRSQRSEVPISIFFIFKRIGQHIGQFLMAKPFQNPVESGRTLAKITALLCWKLPYFWT